MGRGRAKAKQTKVARQLKYGTIHSDLGALQAELSRQPVGGTDEPDHDADQDPDQDPYASYEDEDDTSEEPARRR